MLFTSILRSSLSTTIRAQVPFAIRSFTSITRQPNALSLLRQSQFIQSSQAIQQSISSTSLITSTSAIMTPVLQLLRFASRGNRRGGNRGNTYQPSTIKRKRKLGFLARMKTTSGRKIVKRRKLKGRWYLTH